MIRRKAVRALIVSEPEQCLLLIRICVPDSGQHIWLAPGGGVESGEANEVALRREVREETGAVISAVGAPVWKRRHSFVYRAQAYDQSELFYLIRTKQFEPTGKHNPAAQELEITQEYRWWGIDEIGASNDVFVPLSIAEELRYLLAGLIPTQPRNVGV